jgi:poly-gamma-glutamate capsule biosynthesis protein CapA/YwtB (metallophosphatase superfamily)
MYDAHPSAPAPRPSLLRRPATVIAVVVAALLIAALAGVAALAAGGADEPRWQAGAASPPASVASPTPSGTPAAPAPAPAPDTISMSATGDIIMGNAPNRLPSAGGKGFFAGVRKALAADLVMGNLEEPLTEDTGHGKCGAGSTSCHQFRAPPGYAAHLREAGFELLNQANNHGHDYGASGYRNTQEALEEHGLLHTGAPDQITVADVEGVKVAVVGFSSYPWSNSLIDIDEAKRVVQKAAEKADLVVVQVHMGAEGSDRTRVKPGTEMFLGENRGDPVRFSHAVIDAGADLVVGHGPHVLRGMEFYKGRLIAYSLGNFAGGAGTLSGAGRLGWGAVLKVSLRTDGTFTSGQFISTVMNGAGKPTMDERKRGLDLVADLSTKDFPDTGARISPDGDITPPAG